MAQRNISEEMDDEVVNMLLREVEKAYPLYQRFLRAKAKMLHLTPNPSPKGDGNFGNSPSSSEKRNGTGEMISGAPSPSGEGWGEAFSIWDIGAPLGSVDKDFTFDEAYDLHLSVMQDFDQEFYDYSLRMIEEERIDVLPHAGKRGGAFASYRK